MRHDAADLIGLFDGLFATREATVLVRGGAEPLYLPPGPAGAPAQVVFAHGFFASALHEIAHWCIAGVHRRRLADYGYWYKPDGRTPAEQREFEAFEVRPQALEWLFAAAAGSAFHFSADNLNGGADSPAAPAWQVFQASVARQARAYAEQGPPPRAARFLAALASFYDTGDAWRRTAAEAAPAEARSKLASDLGGSHKGF